MAKTQRGHPPRSFRLRPETLALLDAIAQYRQMKSGGRWSRVTVIEWMLSRMSPPTETTIEAANVRAAIESFREAT